MVIKVSIPNRLQFKVIPGIRNVLFAKRGDIHYIGGADVLPPPLEAEEEQMVIEKLSTEEGTQAKTRRFRRAESPGCAGLVWGVISGCIQCINSSFLR